jgi:hypothetical protein
MPSSGPLAQFPLLSGVAGDAVERWELRVFDVDVMAMGNATVLNGRIEASVSSARGTVRLAAGSKILKLLH